MLPDGTKIVENYSDLTDGSILLVINVDPTGITIGQNLFWTGTNEDGTSAQEIRVCRGWKDLIPNALGMIGSTGHTSTLWSSRSQARCNTAHQRLVCFQQ